MLQDTFRNPARLRLWKTARLQSLRKLPDVDYIIGGCRLAAGLTNGRRELASVRGRMHYQMLQHIDERRSEFGSLGVAIDKVLTELLGGKPLQKFLPALT